MRQRQVRFRLPHLVVPGVDITLEAPVYNKTTGALDPPAAPPASNFEIYDAGGTLMASGAITGVVGSIPQVTLLGATTAAWKKGMAWRMVWLLDYGGTVIPFENALAVVRYSPPPVVVDQDLYDRRPHLDPANPASVTAKTNFVAQRFEAWVELQQKLLADDRRPWLILDQWALRALLMELTLAHVYEDLATRLNPEFRTTALDHRKRYEHLLSTTPVRYDDAGEASDGQGKRRRGLRATVWLTGASDRGDLY
jgi:hypothetical protein